MFIILSFSSIDDQVVQVVPGANLQKNHYFKSFFFIFPKFDYITDSLRQLRAIIVTKGEFQDLYLPYIPR